MMNGKASRRAVLTGAAAAVAASVAAPVVGTGRAAAGSAVSGPQRWYAITNVTVVDGTGGPARRNMTVLVSGDRIVDVQPARRISVPLGAVVVDGKGKFLIPGLVDMHVHSTPLERTFPPLHLVNGVTTIREMGFDNVMHRWRQEVEAGTRSGPRASMGSLIVDGEPSLWDGIGVPFVTAPTADAARLRVREQKATGADFIKTYTRLAREAFFALADESRRQSIPFLGHVPDFVRLTEAADAGLHTVEHLYHVWYETSSREAEIRRMIEAIPIAGGEYAGWYNKMHAVEYAAAKSYDRSKARRVFEQVARRGTAVTPTLAIHRLVDVPDTIPRTPAEEPLYEYMPTFLRELWKTVMDSIFLAGRPPGHAATRRELYERRFGLVHDMAAAGVPLLAGTDLGTAYMVPGFVLHDELELLAHAGIANRDVIKAATSEPAQYLGLPRQGTVEKGKAADLVLLDADPLTDIRNTRKIRSLFVRGRYIDQAERERIFQDIRAAAAEAPAAGTTVALAACPCHGGRPHVSST